MTSLSAVVVATVLLGQMPPAEFKEYGETIVGEWVIETEVDIDVKPIAAKGDKLEIKVSNKWVANKNAISTQFSADINGTTVGSGNGIIGWDKSAKRIVEYGFDSLGGRYEGVIQKRGDKWFRSGMGVGFTGHVEAGMSIVTIVDANTHKSLDLGRISPDGKALPNKTLTIRRAKKKKQ